MRGANPKRGRPTDSLIPQPTPDHHRQFTSRDSDASFASSRPSTIGATRFSAAELYTDRAQQNTAVRAINSYLSSHSSSHALRTHPISSAKEITDTLQFLLHQLDFPVTKLEDDFFIILKSLNCPFKVNKSTLRAPNTPHNWPACLALIHWLVQICLYTEYSSVNSRGFVQSNSMFVYFLDTYLNFLQGDDDAVEAIDREYFEKLENERDIVADNVRVLESTFRELEAKSEGLKVGPTEKEKLESLRNALEEDVGKFNAMMAELNSRNEALNRVLEEKRTESEVKVEEKKRIDSENEELKKRVDEQSINSRDAERMKRELQAVERDIGEAEGARNSWEEKTWDLDAEIGHKIKELETLAMDANQAIRRLKLGFQYMLNTKGSTPAEVMGVDYRSVVKPGLASFADDVRKSSMEKMEGLISLQRESSELTARVEAKNKRLAALQSRIDDVEAQLILLRNETEEFTNRCAVEAQKLSQDVQMEAHNLDVLEREAADFLKAGEVKLQEAMKETDEEIQIWAHELFAVVDTVSKYKEHMVSKISDMKSKLSETAVAVSDIYKLSLASQLERNC
ncbi:kinetochore protein NDC80 homolog [Mercurialis annua]|uniref:kinetochore protein NDC80 homolog n=1 Tax=Mercurialis annua TaxID=3986 RepID=UPI0021604910|nr:kinetochore protein NDC80 homolog [Mercurialis annua]